MRLCGSAVWDGYPSRLRSRVFDGKRGPVTDSLLATQSHLAGDSSTSNWERLRTRFAQGQADVALIQDMTEGARRADKSRALLGWLAQNHGTSGKGILAIISVLLDVDEKAMARQVVHDALSLHEAYGDYLSHFAEFLISANHYTKGAQILGWLCELMQHDFKLHHLYLKTLYRLGDHRRHHALSQAFAEQLPNQLDFALEDIRTQVYRPGISRQEIHANKRQWATSVQTLVPEEARPAPRETSTLRIALVGDYLHPMFIEPILRHYDSSTIDLHIFTNDSRVQEIWQGTHHPLPLDDLKGVAATMRAMQIDILIEMTARMEELELMSYRPAPLQGGWIATSITQVFSFSDFVLADPVIIPEQERDDWSEEIVDLPVWAPFTFFQNVPEVQPCPSINQGYVTFGACQRAMKFNHEMLVLWGQLLERIPKSRLVLKDQSFEDPLAAQAMRVRCQDAKIDLSRLILEPGTPHPKYYEYYHQVDISLDTYPYGGGILTAESLWMGVPVVTLQGDRFNGRLAQTYLQAVGAEQWVTETPQDYIDVAAALAADLECRKQFRTTSRSRMLNSPIMQHEAYGQRWSEVMWKMHRSHLASFNKD